MIKNPTNYKFLKQIKIEKVILKYLIKYNVFFKNENIGIFKYSKTSNSIEFAWVSFEFQRKGLGSYVYNYIEKDLRIKLKPSKSVLPKGKLFWKARLKQKNPKLNGKTLQKLEMIEMLLE